MPKHIDAKTVDAAREPEAQHVVHRCANRGIAPVEVRLLCQKCVVVILVGGGVECPGAATEVAQPVVGRPASGRTVAPDVPVTLRVVARAAAFAEPRVLIGRVVRHEIENHPEIAAVRVRKERIEVRQRAELRCDVAVVGNVVAAVLHR